MKASTQDFETRSDQRELVLNDLLIKVRDASARERSDPYTSEISRLEMVIRDCQLEQVGLRSIVAECQDFVRPVAVLNRSNGVVHAARSRFSLSPLHWTSPCGWRWPFSCDAMPITSETHLAGAKVCRRCTPSFPSCVPYNPGTLLEGLRRKSCNGGKHADQDT